MSRAFACAVVAAGLLSSIAYADMAAPPQERSEPAVRPRLPPQPPQPPGVSPLIAQEAQALAGSWACKGVQIASNGSSTPMTAALTASLELDGAWLHLRLVDATPITAKLDIYRTFDSVAKQWTQLVMASDASHASATSIGEQGGVWTWDGTLTSQTGAVQVRDTEQRSAGEIKMWGERLLGGTWQKAYEMTCAKS